MKDTLINVEDLYRRETRERLRRAAERAHERWMELRGW